MVVIRFKPLNYQKYMRYKKMNKTKNKTENKPESVLNVLEKLSQKALINENRKKLIQALFKENKGINLTLNQVKRGLNVVGLESLKADKNTIFEMEFSETMIKKVKELKE
jgi:hypothetical protein